jgi:hypothetical protein
MLRRALLVLFALAAFTAAVLACDRTQPDAGLDASLRVTGAQFFREAMPSDTSGPKVISVTVGSKFSAGATQRSCIGETAHDGTAVAIAIAGDLGYWILPTGLPSASALDAPTFTADLAFSSTMRPGPRALVVRAVDAQHRFGPPLVKAITIAERGVPDGQLVISLSWDNRANLDLHVVDPNGVEIFKRNINSYEPPGPGSSKEAPGTPHDGGVLDFDSHAECAPDGLYTENVVWKDAPPKGHYIARVDTFSLCGESIARWRVQAFSNGVRVGAAEGVGTDVDTHFDHNRGAGVLALEIDVP